MRIKIYEHLHMTPIQFGDGTKGEKINVLFSSIS